MTTPTTEYEKERKAKKQKYMFIGLVILGLLLLLSMTGNGLGWKLHKDLLQKEIDKSDSIQNVMDDTLVFYDDILLANADTIQQIKNSKIVYINTDYKWKKKYEELQKNYDIILYKLYTQQYLDSLAEHFLFVK